MEPILKKVWTFNSKGKKEEQSISQIRKGSGVTVKSYRELVEKVAFLSFKNPEFVLFYRGQQGDYPEASRGTSLYPSIFRGGVGIDTLLDRFNRLDRAENILADRYQNNLEGAKKIKTHRILRWAILQHYDICLTPLLDITHSLRVACSFAFGEVGQNEAFIYVLGLPQISGSVTASSEHGIQIIRLLSICPPKALRPYYQEGYLVGEYPTISYKGKLQYYRQEVDFAQRLICKFKITGNGAFWDKDFPAIPNSYLYPNKRDAFVRLAQRVKDDLGDA